MAAETISLPRLSTNEWDQLACIARHEGQYVISLEEIDFARPSGIVALTLAVHFRQPKFTIVELPPKNSDALWYLNQINFIQMATRFGVRFDRPVDNLLRQQHKTSANFTKILRLNDPDYERAHEVICKHFRLHFSDIFSKLYLAFTEVLINIEDHSGGKKNHYADHIIQVHGFDDKLELAFGDLGVGYLQSLRRNPEHQTLATEQGALSKVIFEGASGVSHRSGCEERGGGLRKALDAVHELGGGFKLVSGNGKAYYMADQWNQYQLGTMSSSFPGTLMAIQIPF